MQDRNFRNLRARLHGETRPGLSFKPLREKISSHDKHKTRNFPLLKSQRGCKTVASFARAEILLQLH